jgi:hypothetical protein
MRLAIITYGLGVLGGGLLGLAAWQYFGTIESVSFTVFFSVALTFLAHRSLIERKQVRTCPKCKEWWNVDRINRFDSSDRLVPPAIGNNVSVIYKLSCNQCGHSWDVLHYEENGYS